MRKLLPILFLMGFHVVSCNKGEELPNGEKPGLEKEEYRMDDANITTPIDNRPDLEEED